MFIEFMCLIFDKIKFFLVINIFLFHSSFCKFIDEFLIFHYSVLNYLPFFLVLSFFLFRGISFC